MNKIALMTWHHAENYGTAFQAYALKRLIEQQGYEVDLIDYTRLNSLPLDHIGILKVLYQGIITVIKKIFKRSLVNFKFKSNTFCQFYNSFFTYTNKCLYNQDFDQLNNQYIGFVCGSDQIWNPNNFDARYFLDFVRDPERLIAYAPSVGVTSITNEHVSQFMKREISRFQFVSVREKSGCELISRLTGRKDVFNALDPVIMLPKEEWIKLEEPFACETPYALIFFLANNSQNIQIAIEAVKNKGLNPLVLHCTQTEDTPFANTEELSPAQLLYCIHHASYVCTDSFHITVLSIIFHRQLMTFMKQLGGNGTSQYNRITDLLERLGIEGGIYTSPASFNDVIDYSDVDDLLSEQRSNSIEYLRKALSGLKPLGSISFAPCSEQGECNGALSPSFADYIQTQSGKKRDFMLSCRFALQAKCYRCKYLQKDNMTNGRMPLFYEELEEDIKRNPDDVYNKHYRDFHILSSVKKILKK